MSSKTHQSDRLVTFLKTGEFECAECRMIAYVQVRLIGGVERNADRLQKCFVLRVSRRNGGFQVKTDRTEFPDWCLELWGGNRSDAFRNET